MTGGFLFFSVVCSNVDQAVVMLSLSAVMCLKLLFVIMTSAWADFNVHTDTVNRATQRPEEAFPWSQPQLPTSVKPDQYFLSIHPDLGTDSFTGHVHILITVLNDTRLIVLYWKGLSITEATLQDVTVWGTLLHRDSARQQERPARDPVTLRMLESTGTEQLALLSDVLLVPGCKYKLYLSYSGMFSGGYSGIYKASYRSPTDASPRYIVATHFEPSSARKAFPCFDEPNRKAQFSLAVVRQRGHITLSNMPKLYTKVREDGLEEDFYQTSVRMSSYLLAFVVCDYSVNSAETKRGVKVSVFTASHQVNQTHHALHTAVEILDFYEELFQIAYPLPKLDLVTIPDFEAMAMENWGLVMFKDWSLFHQDHRDGVRGQFWVSLITAHELAHQWFGNLVTMHWWKDLWLNEGFASYLEHVALRHIKPDWCEPDVHMLMNTFTALNSDSMLTSHPLSLSVSSSTQIKEMFDDISYYKGASVIAMLNAYLSDPVFICGIRHYLKEHCYGTATPDDLWRAMTEAAQRRNMTVDVKALMDTWITQRGYPLVTASVHGARLYLRQSPFTILAHNDTDAAVWQIPFTFYTSNSSSVFTHLMKGKEEMIQLPEQVAWIKANVNSSGFYRVSYDSLTLRALVTELQGGQSVLSPADRTGLMDDTFHLARQGSVRYSDAFTLSMFLMVEEEYLPITVFIHNMRNIIIKMAFAREPCITHLLKQHLWSMLGRQASAQRWEDTGSLAVQNKRKNLLEVAVQAGRSPTSEQEALRLFHFWMARDGDYPLPSSLRGLIFQVGVKRGDDVEWTFLLHRYCNCTSSKERTLMLAALSRTSDQEKILWLLSNSLQNNIIKTQDLAIIVNIVACRERSNEIAWTFLQKHWDQLVEKFTLGSPYLSGIVTATTSHFSCTQKYDEVYEFFVTEKRLDHLHFVRTTLETIKANIHWLRTSTVAIRSWLQKTYIYTFKTCPLCKKEYTYHFRWGTTFHIDV